MLEYANQLSEEAAATLYDICQISHLLKRRTNQLSGGEKQRIALAKLLITSPRLLLLDEPFSNTDMVHKKLLKSVIGDIGSKLKISCIMVSHDPLDTLSWADEVLVMKDGEVIQQGGAQDIYKQPTTEYTAGLFGTYNLLSHSMARLFTNTRPTGKRHQKLFLRPEDIHISLAAGAGIEATVKEILFYGSYYEVEVLVGKSRITVRMTGPAPTKDDTIYLTLPTGTAWYI